MTKLPDNNTCLSVDLLMRYINKKLTPEELDYVEQHIDTCALCSNGIEGALLYLDNTKKLFLNMEMMHRIGYRLDEKYDYYSTSRVKNTTNNTYSLQELLDMFATVPHYDALLTEVHRSAPSNSTSAPLVVLSPANESDCSDGLHLIFNKATQNDIEICIEDNEEEPVIEAIIAASSSKYELSTKNLRPGCYYWRLYLNNGDYLIGKFYIQKHFRPRL